MKKLVRSDIRIIALRLHIEPAALQAVQVVETGGRGGFVSDTLPTILFEGHIFWRQLRKRGIDPLKLRKGNETILYPRWTKEHYLGGLSEYGRLKQAMAIHPEAANESTSWGMFQIMGFNHQSCGVPGVDEFVKLMSESEYRQLSLAAEYLRSMGLCRLLRDKNWDAFACRYNGPGYGANKYGEKLRKAYLGCQKGF